MEFASGHHCHWTYRLGPYISPWCWPDRESAQQAAQCMPDPDRDPPEVYQVHGVNCRCEEVASGPGASG